MGTSNFQTAFLHFVDFSQFNNWNVKQYVNTNLLKSNFKIEFLAEHLIEQNNKIKPFDFPEKDFAILGVDNKVGIFDAYISKGKEINQPYKKMETGFIAYNPYRINVGSIGLKTEKHQHQYISPAYVVFSCQTTLLPEYLFLVFKTNFYNRIIRENTTGSVRQNLSFDNLIKMQIPLPDINTQKALAQAYQDKMAKADELEKQANQIDSDIEQYLFEQLGIEIQQTQKVQTGKLQFVNFRDLNLWGVVSQDAITAETIFKSNQFKNKPITNFFEINPTTQIPSNQIISFIPMANVSDIYGEISIYDKQTLKPNYTKFKENDLIWAKITPCMENGKSAIASNLENGFGFGSTEFHVLRAKNKDFSIHLLHSLLRTSHLRKIATQYFTGSAGQQRVPKSFLKALTLPVLNLEIQTKILTYIQTQKQQQKDSLATASAYRIEALMEFEKAIFK
ncbi:hypothetical protein HMPREF0027_1593 [Actinobacillus ureae ATCC 25976]|uniref:Type I restriction modification DNA specificity domain-containing protein n=1 Tax=Actinobacillus ureae ATCC 25976 TaxID=887324 RepID=E8KIC6_9PAST|nr:restriction endonuclease subunit S [Actinobacillus ureae]EFX91345.1 hypothetical protein HMPREF0027_1593 [Actinobacillus ureae ATCC 25976]